MNDEKSGTLQVRKGGQAGYYIVAAAIILAGILLILFFPRNNGCCCCCSTQTVHASSATSFIQLPVAIPPDASADARPVAHPHAVPAPLIDASIPVAPVEPAAFTLDPVLSDPPMSLSPDGEYYFGYGPSTLIFGGYAPPGITPIRPPAIHVDEPPHGVAFFAGGVLALVGLSVIRKR